MAIFKCKNTKCNNKYSHQCFRLNNCINEMCMICCKTDLNHNKCLFHFNNNKKEICKYNLCNYCCNKDACTVHSNICIYCKLNPIYYNNSCKQCYYNCEYKYIITINYNIKNYLSDINNLIFIYKCIFFYNKDKINISSNIINNIMYFLDERKKCYICNM
jgi:hypothetical protein